MIHRFKFAVRVVLEAMGFMLSLSIAMAVLYIVAVTLDSIM